MTRQDTPQFARSAHGTRSHRARTPPLVRTYVRMRSSGNSDASDHRRRFQLALRGHQPDRVLDRARTLQDAGELTLRDAAQVCGFLAEHDDHRYSRAAARLAARLTLALRLDLDLLDEVLAAAANASQASNMAELVRLCDRADEHHIRRHVGED